MANLNDILQGLIDTDRGIIGKLRKMKDNGLGSSIIDTSNSSLSGTGSIVTDMAASNGSSYRAQVNGSGQCLYSGTFNNVKFGHYALCLRARVNSNVSSEILQLVVKNGSSVILSKNITGAIFESTTKYGYVYSTFIFEGDGKVKNDLKFEINSLSTNGIVINVDYVYINLITPAVYV